MTHTNPTPQARHARKPKRRTVITAAATTAVLTPVAVAYSANASEDGPAFLHGVASGDPLPDGILLWTRVTPEPDAVPGSGKGRSVKVRWEVSEDRDFRKVASRGTVTAEAAGDHTVKADVRGLRPATGYFYRFTADGTHSPVGRTRTAPAEGAAADNLRFGVVSCSNWEAGHFSAYRHLAGRTDLHAVLHLGDYIYEYPVGGYGSRGKVIRPHTPEHETLTLADYRARNAQYKSDPDSQRMHAAHPLIAIWDDHEIANDWWKEGAENHTPGEEGAWADRMRVAKQAYFEWMPVRPSIEGTTYRRLRFGTLADLHLLDLRSFRDQQVMPGKGDIDSPNRTLTGHAQLDWLKAGLSASQAKWRLVGTSVMISPMAFGSLPAYLLRPIAKLLGLPEQGLAINTDQWDGYTHDRRELLSHLRSRGIDNTVFLTGDIHMSWANDVPIEAATYPASPTAATEFVITSVTSDNVDDILNAPPGSITPVAAPAIRAANRHAKWVDTDAHGYGVLDITTERAQMDFYAISDKTKAEATSKHSRSYRTLSGTQRVERAEQPVL
ncbi:alkaline phosphatase D family protein [Streptomyces gobiensis]|uniref:alkaline phosphatase D family protein n=1 Tax=Streptomyces gobiensis TaxID=2875706 RepID=UPI001E5679A5|nr:alkaline phosphatase D family protein [Streptomyces gobiensis]UGY90861.1 alkaline phosphatase D family protein [Streptomyces gobiensis]